MNLGSYQRAFAELCLAPDPASALDALGGDRGRWILYREMVRNRLIRNVRDAFPRLTTLMGPRFDQVTSEMLAQDPVKSRFLRDAPVEWARWLTSNWERWGDGLPEHARSLCQYEATLWEVRDRDSAEPAGILPFDFENPIAFNPTMSLLRLDFSVWDRRRPDQPAGGEPAVVLVYREPKTEKVSSVVVDRRLRALIATCFETGASAGAVGRALAARGLLELTPAWVDLLCDRFALYIDRGLILGCAPGPG